MNPRRSNRMLQLAVRFVSTMGLVATGLPSFLAAGSFLAGGRGKPRTSTESSGSQTVYASDQEALHQIHPDGDDADRFKGDTDVPKAIATPNAARTGQC